MAEDRIVLLLEAIDRNFTKVLTKAIVPLNSLTLALKKTGATLEKSLGRFGRVAGVLLSLGFAFQMISRPLMDFFKGVVTSFSELGGASARLMNNALQEAQVNFKLLSITLGARLSPIITWISNLISRLITWFLDLNPKTQKVIAVFGLLLAVGTALAGTIAFLALPFVVLGAKVSVIVGIISLLVVAVVGAIAIFTEFKDKLIEKVTSVVDIISEKFSWIRDIIRGVFDAIVEFFSPFVEAVKTHVDNFISVILKIGEIFGTVKDMIFDILTLIFDKVIKPIFNGIIDFVKAIWESDFVKTIRNAITTIAEVILKGLTVVKGIVTIILGTIRNVFVTIFNGIISVVEGAMNAIVSLINLVISAGQKIGMFKGIRPIEELKLGRFEKTEVPSFGDIIVNMENISLKSDVDIDELAKRVGEKVGEEVRRSTVI